MLSLDWDFNYYNTSFRVMTLQYNIYFTNYKEIRACSLAGLCKSVKLDYIDILLLHIPPSLAASNLQFVVNIQCIQCSVHFKGNI